MMVKTKYNGQINFEVYREYCVNNIFKILLLMEKKKEWQSHLKGFLVELNGIESMTDIPQFTALLGRLEGLFSLVDENGEVEERQLFRKTVLDSISLIKSIEVGGE